MSPPCFHCTGPSNPGLRCDCKGFGHTGTCSCVLYIAHVRGDLDINELLNPYATPCPVTARPAVAARGQLLSPASLHQVCACVLSFWQGPRGGDIRAQEESQEGARRAAREPLQKYRRGPQEEELQEEAVTDARHVQPAPPCWADVTWRPIGAHTTPLAARRPCYSFSCGRRGNPRRVVTHTWEGVEYGGPCARLKGRIIRWYSLWQDCG